MDSSVRRGSLEMIAAMLISGTIGWFVLVSGQPVLDVVFWRCVFGTGTLLLVCAAFGFLRPGVISRTAVLLAIASLSLIHISEPTRPRFGSRMPSSA